MLTQLHIENIAVIEKADIEFGKGLTVLTGETGAGKSIIVDSLGAVLGARTSRELVRTGAEYGVVSAVFETDAAAKWFEDNDFEPEDEIIIRRKISADGKNNCRVCGNPVTVSQLRQLGSLLLDIHGQNDGRQLMDEDSHLAYLDGFGKTSNELAAFSEAYREYTACKREMDKLSMDEAEKERLADSLRYRIEELENAQLKVGEEDELIARRDLLRNSEKLTEALDGAYSALYACDENAGSLVDEASALISKAALISDELRGCIKFIEEHTGEKFDWDAFAKALESYNEVTRFHLDLWEINRTDHPQVTGPTPWLYRMYTYHLHGGMDQRFNKADKRVHKLMTDAYEKRLPCSAEMRHKALVWSCPANYYTNFSNWLEQCWGIVSVMDMETHISQVIIDTSTPETMLEGVALTYQRATMRKHTKGGYRNAVDEMWRVAEEYNVDTIIMYDQISCKGMDGLQGIFDEQARERNINFIWVQQDLMDPRTISRRDMRRQVNQYMTSVLRETPVDPTLLDFDDCDAF